MSEFVLIYVSIGMPCESPICKTKKNSWFRLREEQGDMYREIQACEECIYELNPEIYKEMEKKALEFGDLPDWWVKK